MESWLQEYLESIRDSAFETRDLQLNRKQLRQIDWLPDRCWHLQLQENLLTTLPQLCDQVELLNVSKNRLVSLPEKLPADLKYLDISHNPNITSIPPLPEGLQIFKAVNCNLRECPKLPSTLQYLYIENNLLTSFPSLPPKLEVLQIHNNYIQDIPTHIPVKWKSIVYPQYSA